MMSSFPKSLILFSVLWLVALPSFGFETDQYNLPPEPLANIGNEVSDYVEANLIFAIETINGEIEHSVACLKNKTKGEKKCDSADAEFKKLLYLRSDAAVADELYRTLAGSDIMFTKFGKWMNAHKFRAQPDRYKVGYSESIFVLNPADFLMLSPTVRLYGSEFGIDKLEHFFQQGHKYFQIEKRSTAKGDKPSEAVDKAIRWGQRTERTYYGLISSGVYSNADLHANYVGMKFYQGLTQPLRINGITRPATLRIKNGSWQADPAALGDSLLKPFIGDHLNEALNPSSFRLTLVRSVRREVKKHACPKWHRAFPDLTAAAIDARSKTLQLWNGEDYGYTPKDRFVTIGETCFKGSDR
ncbi:MAG: hypothetical protein ABIV48_00590 [Pyrinomonadaceae bacterium]